MVAPPLAYGSSGEHQGFAGTLSIGQEATELLLVELGRSAAVDFAHVIVVSTHGATPCPVSRAMARLAGRRAPGGGLVARVVGRPHAGRTETSLMLAIAPERVQLDRAEAGDRRPLGRAAPPPAASGVRAVSANGVLGDPTGATRRRGAPPAGRAPSTTWSATVEATGMRLDHGGDPMNRVAVVTGAARGIGAATVAGLAAAGWSVVAVDRARDDPRLPYAMGTAAELEAVVASARPSRPAGRLGAPTGPGGGQVADTTDPDALAAAVAVAEERFGGLDAMVAVAGVIAGGVPLWEMPGDELGAVLGVDLGGPITAARVGIPALLRRPAPRQGRFLAVASAAATRGLPMLAAYGAAKAGVAGLVRGLAVELAGTGDHRQRGQPRFDGHGHAGRERPALRPGRHPVLRRPAARRAPARPRGGGGRAGVAGRCRTAAR